VIVCLAAVAVDHSFDIESRLWEAVELTCVEELVRGLQVTTTGKTYELPKTNSTTDCTVTF